MNWNSNISIRLRPYSERCARLLLTPRLIKRVVNILLFNTCTLIFIWKRFIIYCSTCFCMHIFFHANSSFLLLDENNISVILYTWVEFSYVKEEQRKWIYACLTCSFIKGELSHLRFHYFLFLLFYHFYYFGFWFIFCYIFTVKEEVP
jgi:hypothetical protein